MKTYEEAIAYAAEEYKANVLILGENWKRESRDEMYEFIGIMSAIKTIYGKPYSEVKADIEAAAAE